MRILFCHQVGGDNTSTPIFNLFFKKMTLTTKKEILEEIGDCANTREIYARRKIGELCSLLLAGEKKGKWKLSATYGKSRQRTIESAVADEIILFFLYGNNIVKNKSVIAFIKKVLPKSYTKNRLLKGILEMNGIW